MTRDSGAALSFQGRATPFIGRNRERRADERCVSVAGDEWTPSVRRLLEAKQGGEVELFRRRGKDGRRRLGSSVAKRRERAARGAAGLGGGGCGPE
jgi:hypothetical protein